MKNSIKGLPERIIHGDLKLNNIRFDETGNKAIAIVDLDTLGVSKIVIDIGDAIRSWCHKLMEEKTICSILIHSGVLCQAT